MVIILLECIFIVINIIKIFFKDISRTFFCFRVRVLDFRVFGFRVCGFLGFSDQGLALEREKQKMPERETEPRGRSERCASVRLCMYPVTAREAVSRIGGSVFLRCKCQQMPDRIGVFYFPGIRKRRDAKGGKKKSRDWRMM